MNVWEKQILQDALAGDYTPPDYSMMRHFAPGLVKRGLLVQVADNVYRLTDEGTRVARESKDASNV